MSVDSDRWVPADRWEESEKTSRDSFCNWLKRTDSVLEDLLRKIRSLDVTDMSRAERLKLSPSARIF